MWRSVPVRVCVVLQAARPCALASARLCCLCVLGCSAGCALYVVMAAAAWPGTVGFESLVCETIVRLLAPPFLGCVFVFLTIQSVGHFGTPALVCCLVVLPLKPIPVLMLVV